MEFTSYEKFLINLGLAAIKGQAADTADRHRHSSDEQSKDLVKHNLQMIEEIKALQEKIKK